MEEMEREKGKSMAHDDAKRLSRKQQRLDQFKDYVGEMLHDYKGNQYLITDEYFKRQLDQRRFSEEKEIALTVAGQLLRSNLKQLTDKQKQAIIGTMEGKSLRVIAKEMGIYHTAVVKHLEAAKKKLAQLINQTKEVITNDYSNSDQTDSDSEEGIRESSE